MKLLQSVSPSLGLFILATAPALGQITYVSQSRTISASFQGTTQSVSATNFGDFNTSVGIGDGAGGASASISSTLTPRFIEASVSCNATGGFSFGSSSGSMNLVFDLAQPILCSIELSASSFLPGASASISGPGISFTVPGGIQTRTDVLAPGRYTISASCSSVRAAGTNHSSSWGVQLTAFNPSDLAFSTPWWSQDSGGGHLSGGIYDLNGTIAQPDATSQRSLSGGEFSITGGYWARDPGTPPCTADYDDGSGMGQPDGGVTIDDLLFYIELFRLGSASADVDDGSGGGDPDGGVTIDDLLYYLLRFSEGC